jgi:hypothetical protein
MFLGFTGSGKTYLQGSFFKLAYATGNKLRRINLGYNFIQKISR